MGEYQMINKIKILQGDITKISADAIVNAANSSLLGGGGVDGAIHKAGGKQILEECRKIRNQQGRCHVGDAVRTTAGNLPAKYVIHTVGPVWQGGHSNEFELLKNCYLRCFELASDLESIAFPNISTGIYQFPKDLAVDVALNTIKGCLAKYTNIKTVNIVCFEHDNYELYLDRIKNYL